MGASSNDCIFTVSQGGSPRKAEAFPKEGEQIPFLRGPLVPKSFEIQKGATKMAASSIHCIFTVPRDHLDEVRKALKQKAF